MIFYSNWCSPGLESLTCTASTFQPESQPNELASLSPAEPVRMYKEPPPSPVPAMPEVRGIEACFKTLKGQLCTDKSCELSGMVIS